MTRELPTPIRRDLDLQRKDFVRWVGSEYEKLIEKGIDPTVWMTQVVQSLHDVTSEAEHRDAA